MLYLYTTIAIWRVERAEDREVGAASGVASIRQPSEGGKMMSNRDGLAAARRDRRQDASNLGSLL